MKLKAQQMPLLKRTSVSEHCKVCDFDGTSKSKSQDGKNELLQASKNKIKNKMVGENPKRRGKKEKKRKEEKKAKKKNGHPPQIKNSFTNGKDLNLNM